MKKFEGILLVSDLDGTLFDDNCKISVKNLERLKYFTENGGRFSVATGRTAHSILLNAPDLKVNAPSVFHSGAVIYDFSQNKTVEHYFLHESVYSLASEALKKIPFSSIEVLCGDDVYILNRNRATDWHLEIEEFTPHFVEKIPDIPKPWTRISFWNDEDMLKHASDFVKNYCKNLPFQMFKVHSRSFEVVDQNANKGFALNRLRELAGNVKLVVSAGDNENDIMMLENADMSFAPKNASVQAKAAADRVADITSDESFIAYVIDEIDRECETWK